MALPSQYLWLFWSTLTNTESETCRLVFKIHLLNFSGCLKAWLYFWGCCHEALSEFNGKIKSHSENCKGKQILNLIVGCRKYIKLLKEVQMIRHWKQKLWRGCSNNKGKAKAMRKSTTMTMMLVWSLLLKPLSGGWNSKGNEKRHHNHENVPLKLSSHERNSSWSCSQAGGVRSETKGGGGVRYCRNKEGLAWPEKTNENIWKRLRC